MIDYDLIKRNKFPHRFRAAFLGDKTRWEMIAWLKEYCGEYNQDHIYWGLVKYSSTTEIYFKDNDHAFKFRMRWA